METGRKHIEIEFFFKCTYMYKRERDEEKKDKSMQYNFKH